MQIKLQSFGTKWRWVLWLLFLFPAHNTTQVHLTFFPEFFQPILNAHQISLAAEFCVYKRSDWFILALWQRGSKHRDQECQ